MNWYIEDHNEHEIYITNLWTEWYIPKFRIKMVVDEPLLYLYFNLREAGDGLDQLVLKIDYEDVVDGYSGYIDNPSSAQDLKDSIDAMIVSGFAGGGGDILSAKADLLSHNGLSDTILPGGSNGFILQRDDVESTGLKWVDPSSVSTSTGFNDFLLMGS